MGRSLAQTITLIPGIIIAMSFHEFAHAYVAHLMGDDTAKRAGRLTLDPISHINPLGFMMLLIGGFGWAKPVPINENNFRNRKLGVFLVSIAGVTMNIIIATLTLIIISLTQNVFSSPQYYQVMNTIVWLNIAFASFNLLPIPPLDGSKILAAILPANKRYILYRFENYGFIIMIILIMTGALNYLLYPVINVVLKIINFLVGAII